MPTFWPSPSSWTRASNSRSGRAGWFTEDTYGSSSYFSDDPANDDPEIVTDPGGPEVADDPRRFGQLDLLDLEPTERQMLICGLSEWVDRQPEDLTTPGQGAVTEVETSSSGSAHFRRHLEPGVREAARRP